MLNTIEPLGDRGDETEPRPPLRAALQPIRPSRAIWRRDTAVKGKRFSTAANVSEKAMRYFRNVALLFDTRNS